MNGVGLIPLDTAEPTGVGYIKPKISDFTQHLTYRLTWLKFHCPV